MKARLVDLERYVSYLVAAEEQRGNFIFSFADSIGETRRSLKERLKTICYSSGTIGWEFGELFPGLRSWKPP